MSCGCQGSYALCLKYPSKTPNAKCKPTWDRLLSPFQYRGRTWNISELCGLWPKTIQDLNERLEKCRSERTLKVELLDDLEVFVILVQHCQRHPRPPLAGMKTLIVQGRIVAEAITKDALYQLDPSTSPNTVLNDNINRLRELRPKSLLCPQLHVLRTLGNMAIHLDSSSGGLTEVEIGDAAAVCCRFVVSVVDAYVELCANLFSQPMEAPATSGASAAAAAADASPATSTASSSAQPQTPRKPQKQEQGLQTPKRRQKQKQTSAAASRHSLPTEVTVPDALGETPRDSLMRRGMEGSGGSSASGGSGARLAAEQEVLDRLAALRDAPGGEAEWTPRAMRGVLVAAGIDMTNMVERPDFVEACRRLIANHDERQNHPSAAPAPGGGGAPGDRAAAALAKVAMASAAMATDEKQSGNEAFSRGDYQKAVSHYTKALIMTSAPDECALLYSNCAAAYSGMSYYGKAQADAEEAIRLDPGQPKYRCRLGTALLGQRQWREAEAAFREALAIDPSYGAAKQGLTDVRAGLAAST